MERFSAACSPLTCFRHVVEAISVDEGIRSFAQKCGADLIAISNRERHPVKRMLIGSNVELLVNHSEAPVLTIDFD
jgi:nucleotide-binding universal stress UspA family protein